MAINYLSLSCSEDNTSSPVCVYLCDWEWIQSTMKKNFIFAKVCCLIKHPLQKSCNKNSN